MKRSALVIGTLFVLASLAPASAEHLIVEDPNDTKGRADIERVKVEKDGPRKWTIRTFRGWRVNDFFEKGWFFIQLDTVGDERFDYFVFVKAKRRRLGAAIWRDRENKDDVLVRHVNVRKVGKAVMRVSVPFDKIRVGEKRVQFRWYAKSLWSSPKCPRVCIDRAPNNRAVREPLLPTP